MNSRINAEWHRANRMPPRATLDQRVTWHLAHLKACRCRTDLPATIVAELKKRGMKVPGGSSTPSSKPASRSSGAAQPTTIDEYIQGFPPAVQGVLQKIRETVAKAAPDAEERISYRMPAFAQNGILLYFAAFTSHIGIYPPVSGDPALEKALAPYAGPKGNLKFPLDEPIPYALIKRIAAFRVKQNQSKPARGVARARGVRS